MEEAMKDELSVSEDRFWLVEQYKQRIQAMFQVLLQFGLKSKDDNGERRWIEVQGESENRTMAKEYIKSLCNPQETLSMQYPPHLHEVLSNPQMHARLERQSKAAILFVSNSDLRILGVDPLSVTLAMSSVEEIINQYMKEEAGGLEVSSPTAHEASCRLDRELRRLSSEDHNLDWDEEACKSLNSSAVKRALLSLLQEETSSRQTPNAIECSELEAEARGVKKPQESKSVTPMSTADFAAYVSANKTGTGSTVAALPDSEEHLREFALNKGYTEADIQEVFKRSGTNIRASEFLQALHANKRLKGSGFPAKLPTPPEPSAMETDEHLHGYFERLSQDMHEEEEINDLGEIKKRNEERQRLLRAAYDQQQKPGNGNKQTAAVGSYSNKLSGDHGNSQRDSGGSYGNKPTTSRSERRGDSGVVSGKGVAGTGSYGNKGVEVSGYSSYSSRTVPSTGGYSNRGSASAGGHSNRGGYSNQQTTGIYGNQQTTGSYGNQQATGGYSNRQFDAVVIESDSEDEDDLEIVKQVPAACHPGSMPGRRQHHSSTQPSSSSLPQRTRGQSESSIHAQPAAATGVHMSRAPVVHGRRRIVIDGSNVAMAHGKHSVFSCRGIELCVEFFLKRGHTEITALVPQWRTRRGPGIIDQQILHSLNEKGFLEFTPSRRAGGKFITPYDDRLIIQTADMTDGIIISNDNYRDLYDEKPEWQELIKTRLVQYMFVGDLFIIAEVDPVGQGGPTLDQLLTLPQPGAAGPSTAMHRPNMQVLPYHPPSLMGQYPGPGHPKPPRAASHPPHPGRGGAWTTMVPPAVERQRGPTYRHPPPSNSNSLPANVPGKINLRSAAATEDLIKQLVAVFPDNVDKVRRVVHNHPTETDLNKLSAFILNILW